VSLRSGPTPYEVWRAKHPGPAAPSPSKKFAPKDWDGLVARLYASNKAREASVNSKQNANLAGELKGRTRVIQRRFNVSVPRARVPETALTLRERSER
jgi:hypothetical protein